MADLSFIEDSVAFPEKEEDEEEEEEGVEWGYEEGKSLVWECGSSGKAHRCCWARGFERCFLSRIPSTHKVPDLSLGFQWHPHS